MVEVSISRNKLMTRLNKLIGAGYDRSGVVKAILNKLENIDTIREIKYILSEEQGTIVFYSANSASIIDVEDRNTAWWLRRWVFFDEEEGENEEQES